jgi:mRNA-degrading endonuclease RelE of RelBE toxin-antitoxin system
VTTGHAEGKHAIANVPRPHVVTNVYLLFQDVCGKKIDAMGLRLGTFQHYRMTDSDKYRLRIGDYRVIYRVDLVRGEIYLVAIGHRREIYRD